jgi:hypothetical protein
LLRGLREPEVGSNIITMISLPVWIELFQMLIAYFSIILWDCFTVLYMDILLEYIWQSFSLIKGFIFHQVNERGASASLHATLCLLHF